MSDKSLTIDLRPGTKSIIKFGFAFQGFLIMIVLVGFVFLAFQLVSDIPLLSLILVAIAIFFIFIAKQYLGNAFYKEQITINDGKLIISYRSFLKEKIHEFDLNEIKYLSHAGTHEYTDHPMNNDIVDFTGLGTTERELQFLIDEGTLEIETEDEVLRFGKNMSSWDAEEAIAQIEKHTGKKFINKYPTETIDENEIQKTD